MARWRRVAGTWLALAVTAALGQGPDLGEPADPPPAPAVAIWETPGHLILPDKPLLDRGLVLLQRTAENQQETLTLVRLQDGATLWAVPIDGPIASSNVAGEVVLIALRDRVMGLAVPDGKLLWEQPLTFPIDTGWAVSPQFAQSQWFKDRSISGQGTGGGLLVIGDRFFLCVQGTIFGASAQTGDILWKRKLCFSLSFPLLGYGELVLAATSDKGFGALNAADGSVVWGHGLNRVQAVFTVGDEIYAAHKDEGLVRLEPASGQVLWQAAIDTEPKMKLTPVGNRLVVQCDQAVHILDREHGDRLWKGDHPGLKSALRDDVIYYQDGAKGPLVCKQVADLAERWRVKPKDPGVWSLHAAPETLIVMAPGTVEGFDTPDRRTALVAHVGAGRPVRHGDLDLQRARRVRASRQRDPRFRPHLGPLGAAPARPVLLRALDACPARHALPAQRRAGQPIAGRDPHRLDAAVAAATRSPCLAR